MLEQSNNIEKGIKEVNSKKAFETLKKLTRKQQHKATVIEDKNGSLLTDNTAVLIQWTEYCQELYSILESKTNSVDETDDMQVMKEVEEATRTLKGGKSPATDNIPEELLKHDGHEMIKVLTTLCQRIWKTKDWPKEWTQSMIIPLKKGNLRLCKHFRTISLISHPSKIML